MDPERKQILLGLRSVDKTTLERETTKCAKGLKRGFLTIMFFAARYGLMGVCMHVMDRLERANAAIDEDVWFNLIIECVNGCHPNLLCAVFDRIKGDQRALIFEAFGNCDFVFKPRRVPKIFGHKVFTRYTEASAELRMNVFLDFSSWSIDSWTAVYEISPCLKLCEENFRDGNFLQRIIDWYEYSQFGFGKKPVIRDALVQAIHEVGCPLDDEVLNIVGRGCERGLELLVALGYPIEHLCQRSSFRKLCHIRDSCTPPGTEIPFSCGSAMDWEQRLRNYERWDGLPVKHISWPLVRDDFFTAYNFDVDDFNADLEASKIRINQALRDMYISAGYLDKLFELDVEFTEEMRLPLIRRIPGITGESRFYKFLHDHGLSVTFHEMSVLSIGYIPEDALAEFLTYSTYSRENIQQAIDHCAIIDHQKYLEWFKGVLERAHPVQVTKDTFVRETRKRLPEVLVRMAGDYLSVDGFY